MAFAGVITVFLAALAQANCQLAYDPHGPIYQPKVEPVTETETVTVTQTIRVPVTSDVWVSTVTQHTVTVTHLATDYSYAPAHPETVTSVIAVTATPVSLVRETSCINPVRTVVSVFSSFVTETERKNLHHSITHVQVYHEINTIPVASVQTLVQRVTTTTLRLTTLTVTSTTQGYHSTTQGYHSTTQGYHSTTQGYHSTTQGYHSTTQGYHSTTQGYNHF